MELIIDVTDWKDEILRDEIEISSTDDIVSLLESGTHSSQIARATIVNRELGNFTDDKFAPNKLLLHSGAVMNVATIAKRLRRDYENSRGDIIQVRALVGDPDDEEGQSYVLVDTVKALERSRHALKTVVPGHIRNRLAEISVNSGDVKQAAEELINTIRAIVEEIS